MEEQLKVINAQRQQLEDEAYKRMESESVQSMDVEGILFFRKTTKRFSVKGDEKESAHDWLKKHGFGDLFQETVNANTLSAELKRATEHEDLEVPDELFNNVVLNQIGRRKSSSKSADKFSF